MTNEIKRTAVEQLFIEMLDIQQSGKTLTFDQNIDLLNKYKEIEAEQITDAHYYGQKTEGFLLDDHPEYWAWEYYRETYLKL